MMMRDGVAKAGLGWLPEGTLRPQQTYRSARLTRNSGIAVAVAPLFTSQFSSEFMLQGRVPEKVPSFRSAPVFVLGVGVTPPPPRPHSPRPSS